MATGPTSETTPNVPAMTGTVAACAATVTANGSTRTRGPGSRRASGPASRTMPAVPRKESWNPGSRTNAGSIPSIPAATRLSIGSGSVRLPPDLASIAAPAINALRMAAGPAPLSRT